MNRKYLSIFASLIAVLIINTTTAQEAKEKPKPDFPPIADIVKDAEKLNGYFNLYKKDEDVYLEIPSSMLNKSFLAGDTVVSGNVSNIFEYPGLMSGGSVFYWKVAGKKIYLMLEDISNHPKKGEPVAESVKRAYKDLQTLAVPIVAKTGGTYLINVKDVFFRFPLGYAGGYSTRFAVDASRTNYGTVKAFPKNVEIEVEFAVQPSRSSSIAVPITVNYYLTELPQNGYTPRYADDRIGLFQTDQRDFSVRDEDTTFIRLVKRWNLKKANPEAEKSPPFEPIVYYIDKATPYEYRPTIRAGIMEWNKAFEQAGFIDAIEVRYQEDDATWDAADVRYSTVLWTTTDSGTGIGPSRMDPRTGEIFDADIILDARWLDAMDRNFDYLIDRHGSDLEQNEGMLLTKKLVTDVHEEVNTYNPFHNHSSHMPCQYSNYLHQDMVNSVAAIIVRDVTGDRETEKKKYIHQMLKNLVMHEVGHTLGLRHNFKASAMTPFDKLNDKKYAETNGLGGSVMDYDTANVVPKVEEQGYYHTPTLGLWDKLVIEYGYKEVPGGSPEAQYKQLEEIAKKASTKPYLYQTDEDANFIDPRALARDMTDDLIAFSKQRIQVVKEVWDGLTDRAVNDGEGYQKVRRIYLSTIWELARRFDHTAFFIGGFDLNRDHKGDPDEDASVIPISAELQRDTIKFLSEYAFDDTLYNFDSGILQRLAVDRRSYGGYSTGSFYIQDRIVSYQMMVLRRLFNSQVHQRVVESAIYFTPDEEVFSVDEIFTGITGAIWTELDQDASDGPFNNSSPYISTMRRDLQNRYLTEILLPVITNPTSSYPRDSKAMARLTVTDLKDKITNAMLNAGEFDTLSRAHLSEVLFLINQALEAEYSLN